MIEMTNEMELRIYEALEDRFGCNGQIIVAIEELAELTQALTKWLRYTQLHSEGNLNDIRKNILEEHTGVSVSRIRRTASKLQYDGYQGHDPAERRGFLQGVLAFQNELLDWKTGGVREEEE